MNTAIESEWTSWLLDGVQDGMVVVALPELPFHHYEAIVSDLASVASIRKAMFANEYECPMSDEQLSMFMSMDSIVVTHLVSRMEGSYGSRRLLEYHANYIFHCHIHNMMYVFARKKYRNLTMGADGAIHVPKQLFDAPRCLIKAPVAVDVKVVDQWDII